MAADQDRNEMYRAIGRYVVEFSRLIFHMRNQVVQRVNPGEPELVELTIGEASPRQIADAFFAVCAKTKKLNTDDAKITTRLQAQVIEVLRRRNDLVHGDWWVPGEGPSDPQLSRIKPTRKAGAFTREQIPVEALDEDTDRLSELRQYVAEFGEICFRNHPLIREEGHTKLRIRDIFRLRDGRVVRIGPLAAKRPVP